jgi:hypothetical protein
MSFEQFMPVNKGVNLKDTYTIQAGTKKNGYYSGMIYFNGGMRDALELEKYSNVVLFTDTTNKLIAVKFTNDDVEGHRKLRKNGNHRFITCTSWLHTACTELGYPEKGSGSYKIIEDGLVVLEKPQGEQL